MKEKLEKLLETSYALILIAAVCQLAYLGVLGFVSPIISEELLTWEYTYQIAFRKIADSGTLSAIWTVLELATAAVYILPLILSLVYDILYSERPKRFLLAAVAEFFILFLLSFTMKIASKFILWLVVFIAILLLCGGVLIGPFITAGGGIGGILGLVLLELFGLVGPILAIAAVFSFLMSFFG